MKDLIVIFILALAGIIVLLALIMCAFQDCSCPFLRNNTLRNQNDKDWRTKYPLLPEANKKAYNNLQAHQQPVQMNNFTTATRPNSTKKHTTNNLAEQTIGITSPRAYNNYYQFQRKHVATEGTFGAPLSYKNLDLMHDNLVENAVIREVTDHLELPKLVYKVIKYDLAPAHIKLYKKLINEQLLKLQDGTILDATKAVNLYHLSQKFIFSPVEYSGKIEGLDVIDTIVKDTTSRIIFNNYKLTNGLMMKRYNAGGCYSEVSRTKQDQYVKDFKAGRLETLTANPKSGGMGLNLQITSQVICGELPITERDFQQAVARSWRMGQKKRVVVTILVARNTIQVTLLNRVLKKGEIAAKVLHSKSNLKKDLLGKI